MIAENISTRTKNPTPLANKNSMQVVRKSAAIIKLKKSQKPDIWSLPFTNRKERSHWALPATGGYAGGYETGDAMALVFLKYMRGIDQTTPPINELTLILEAIYRRIKEEGGPLPPLQEPGGAYESLRGQYVGFFNCITQWAWIASRSHHGSFLDRMSTADLVGVANKGLRFDSDYAPTIGEAKL